MASTTIQTISSSSAPSDEALRSLLSAVRTIAVLGIKSGEADDAYRVPRYLQQRGYRILPVNPRVEGVLGETAHASLAEIAEPIDLIDVFRAPQHLPGHVEEILALLRPPKAVWLQQGIRHDAAAHRLERAGIAVVQDRCLMLEHARLFR